MTVRMALITGEDATGTKEVDEQILCDYAADLHRPNETSGPYSLATRATSASTIILISVSRSVLASQPSFALTLAGFPRSESTSAGRYSLGSITTWRSWSSPTWANAIRHISRTDVVRPVATT